MNSKGIRINKLLSQLGICSRREAENWIKQNRVKVNLEFAKIGQIVFESDVLYIDQKKIEINQQEKIYYLLNKPKKTICSLKDNFGRKRVVDLIQDKRYLFSVGRLDYNTTGALLITNDGELTNLLSHPSSEIKRIYQAVLNQKLSKQELDFLNNSENVLINNKKSKQIIKHKKENIYEITLWQGSYHHVKKLFEIVNRKVVELARIEFAGLNCFNLNLGEYRKLTKDEIEYLKQITNVK